MSLIVRPAVQDDLGFFLVTFAKSLRDVCGYAAGVSQDVVHDLFPWLWTTLVVCDDEEPTVVLGWVTYRDPATVAWIFVRPEVRRRGIAKMLLGAASVDLGAPIATPFAPTRGWLSRRALLTFRPWCALVPRE